MPAAIYIETHGGTGVAGSDDHAGVDIGRTFTETPAASTPEEFLRHIREGSAERARRAGQCRQVGALRDRARVPRPAAGGRGPAPDGAAAGNRPEPRSRRRPEDGRTHDHRGRRPQRLVACDLGPEDARELLEAWARHRRAPTSHGRELIELMQSDDFSHAELYKARATHPREKPPRGRRAEVLEGRRLKTQVAGRRPTRFLVHLLLPVVPYVPATTFLGGREGEARAPARESRGGSPWSSTRRRHARRHPHHRARSAPGACRATRST